MILKKLKKDNIVYIQIFTKLRRVLFWDTKMENIDWEKQKKAVIKRVFERGDEIEKEEIVRFYGQEKINNILKTDGK